MTAKKKRAPRRRAKRDQVGTVDGQPMNRELAAAFQAEGLLPAEEPGVFVNRVTLDNTVPGGFRYEQVAVPQPARS